MVELRSPKPLVGVRFPPPVLLYKTKIKMELLKELFRFRRYKVSQGRLIRRLTMTGVWVLFVTAAWKCTQMDFNWVAGCLTWLVGWNTELETLRETLRATADAAIASGLTEQIRELEDKVRAFAQTFVPVFTYSIVGLIVLFGLWFGYRLVQWITFADFLISVEGEMAKVSWPSKGELRSSTFVVLTLFFLLAGVLYVFDLFFVFLFRAIGVV